MIITADNLKDLKYYLNSYANNKGFYKQLKKEHIDNVVDILDLVFTDENKGITIQTLVQQYGYLYSDSQKLHRQKLLLLDILDILLDTIVSKDMGYIYIKVISYLSDKLVVISQQGRISVTIKKQTKDLVHNVNGLLLKKQSLV